MILKFLGRGSAFNIKEGNTAAYIKEDTTLLLIDCGSNIFERIIQNDILNGTKKIYIAITHLHPDHAGSLGDLIFFCYYRLGIKVNLLSSELNLSEYLLYNGVTSNKYVWFHEDIEELDINIKTIYATHCGIYENVYGKISDEYCESDNPKDIFPCFSFIIKHRDKKFFYSGDCSYIDWNNCLIRKCDEFYVDCCLANYNNNVHYNVNKLYNDLYGEYGQSEIPPKNIFCMHFDCDEVISRASELGFSIVENIR